MVSEQKTCFNFNFVCALIEMFFWKLNHLPFENYDCSCIYTQIEKRRIHLFPLSLIYQKQELLSYIRLNDLSSNTNHFKTHSYLPNVSSMAN